MNTRSIVANVTIASTFAMCSLGTATAQSSPPTSAPAQSEQALPSPQSLDGNYQGMLVCEQMPYAKGPLRAPLDINVSSGNAKFARPIFTLDGSRVTGSEIGNGSLDVGGKLHLVSSWITNGTTGQANYDGVVTPKGGTLIGIQTWTLGGETHARQCFAAVVKVRADSPTSAP
jgi:hypothetical protein